MKVSLKVQYLISVRVQIRIFLVYDSGPITYIDVLFCTIHTKIVALLLQYAQ